MVRFAFLFLVVILFLGIGALIQKNPDWLQPYRQKITATTQSFQPVKTSSLKVYQNTDSGYSFSYPSDWVLNPNIPGCGPVWFPQSTSKVWFTVCGPYPDQNLNSLLTPGTASETVDLAGATGLKQTLTKDGGTTTQIFLAAPKGTLALYFTNLEPTSTDNYQNSFTQLLTTLKFTP